MKIPTAISIKTRFPEFSSVSDAAVEFAIEEARLEVGSNWDDSSASVALLYLAAHYVAASVARSSSGGDGGSGQVRSESIGRLSITYATNENSSATAEDKDSTSYGRRFLEIMQANFAGPVIV